MDDVIDDIMRTARRCEAAAQRYDDPAVRNLSKNLSQAADAIGEAWSGSWIGYQANIYTADLQPKPPGVIFDPDNHAVRHRWASFDYTAILQAVLRRAGVNQETVNILGTTAKEIEQTFDESKAELLPTLEAILHDHEDTAIRGVLEKVEKLHGRIPAQDYVVAVRPQSMMVTDMHALQGGPQVPPHISVSAWVVSNSSTKECCKMLAANAKHVAHYLQRRLKMKGRTVAKTDGPIFIGHGRSLVWKELKDFIQDRLKLPWEEFNREPAAGLSTKERLLELLDKCPFAFLVMTAEDVTADGKVHARESVIHEIGLFQGRYGWQRAIILLEDGCEEFSNIVGTIQIRFPKGTVKSEFEEIRRVLEREGLL